MKITINAAAASPDAAKYICGPRHDQSEDFGPEIAAGVDEFRDRIAKKTK
jgi:hypothetical protein